MKIFQEETAVIKKFLVSDNKLRITFSIENGILDRRGVFHMNVFSTINVALQAILLFAADRYGLTSDRGELLLRSFNFDAAKEINTTENIDMSMILSKCVYDDGILRVEGIYELEDGAFRGSASICVFHSVGRQREFDQDRAQRLQGRI